MLWYESTVAQKLSVFAKGSVTLTASLKSVFFLLTVGPIRHQILQIFAWYSKKIVKVCHSSTLNPTSFRKSTSNSSPSYIFHLFCVGLTHKNFFFCTYIAGNMKPAAAMHTCMSSFSSSSLKRHMMYSLNWSCPLNVDTKNTTKTYRKYFTFCWMCVISSFTFVSVLFPFRFCFVFVSSVWSRPNKNCCIYTSA